MLEEDKEKILDELNHINNTTLYEFTRSLSSEVVKTPSTFWMETTPDEDRVDEESQTSYRTITVMFRTKFGDEAWDNGDGVLTEDRAILMAHRLMSAAYGILNKNL